MSKCSPQVLLIGDGFSSAFSLFARLKQWGCNYEVAGTFREALSMADCRRYSKISETASRRETFADASIDTSVGRKCNDFLNNSGHISGNSESCTDVSSVEEMRMCCKKGDLTMYRTMFTGMICLMLLGIFSVPTSRADEWNKKMIVTVNQPIQVPGKVLPAGTYVFKLLDSNDRTLVAIFDADETQLITMVQGIPDSRMQTSDNTILQLEERPSGQPEALKAWFYPGDDSGVEFVYPTEKE